MEAAQDRILPGYPGWAECVQELNTALRLEGGLDKAREVPLITSLFKSGKAQ